MKSIAIFNNKGGVGKTTLTYHVSYALAELGYKTLLIDLDPQSNLTLFGIDVDRLHDIWVMEDNFVDDFKNAKDSISSTDLNSIIDSNRSIHFLLKATEDGTDDLNELSPPIPLHNNLGLLPGRLTLYMYEEMLSKRWSDAYRGEPLAIRTITKIRKLCHDYGNKFNFEFILFDTSPSLGMLNRVIISTADGIVIPCMPDMFSLYGIRNIGNCLSKWKNEFDIMFKLISDSKRSFFPQRFVQFLGYTIFNARKYSGQTLWDLAIAHYNYAKQIPETIIKYINQEVREHLNDDLLTEPIGGTSVMHSHSTLPSMAQKYQCPIWLVPSHQSIDASDRGTIIGNRQSYERTRESYRQFTKDLLTRLEILER